jgi:hypothetical protein
LDADGPIRNGDLIEEICKCGDLCEITYNNFLNNDDALKQFKEADPSQAAGKKVGDYKFSPGEVMSCPAGIGPAEVRPSSLLLRLILFSKK